MTQSSTIKVGSGMVVVLLMLVSFGINSAQGGCVCVGDFTSGNCQGDLVVDGAEDISSCSLQATVVSITGSLLIQAPDSNLTSVDNAFNSLLRVAGTLSIASQGQLQSVDNSFMAVRSVGDMIVSWNQQLVTFNAFAGLQSINDLRVDFHPSVGQWAGFSQLTTARSIDFNNNGFTSITNFPALQRVNGTFSINYNGNVTEMANMLPSLTTVGTLRFSGNPRLRSLTGIGALRTASGVILSSSRNLTTIPPFAGLTDLTYDLSLSRLGITSLTGFPLLKAVPNFMQIAYNQNLFQLGGFNSLASISTFHLVGNAVLRQFADFGVLTSVTRFSAADNSVLRDYHGLCQTFKSPVIVSLQLPETIRPTGCNATIKAWPLKTACAGLCSCLRCFPPSLVSAQFRSTGRAVDVTFSAPTNQAGLFSTSCSAIWSNASDLFGANAVCSWQTDTKMTIFFPEVPPLQPGQSISLNSAAGAVRAQGALATDPFAVGAVQVAAPVNPVGPAAQLVVPGVSSCSQSITFDASGSRAIGNPTYAWSSPDGALAGLLSGITTSRATISLASLPKGVEYSVSVTIADPFSGQQDSRTQNFTIPERPVPFVSIGTAQRPIVASQPNTIAATASHPCAQAGDSLLAFSWSLSPDASLAVNTLQSLNQRDLVLPANFLPVGQTFLATLTVSLSSDSSLNSSASVQLVVQSQSIVADLGGSLRMIPYTSHTTLVAKVLSGGGGPAAYAYNWSCAMADATAGECPIAAYLAAQSGGAVTIESPLLEAGVSVFVTVTISQPDAQQSGSATTAIVRASTEIPVVTLAAPARVNVNQPNAVTSQVNSTSSALTYKWALLQGPPGFALNASTLASAATLDTANLVVRRGALAVGLQYTVQLTVTDENGFIGVAQATMTTNIPPVEGSFTSAPASGLAATTPFALQFAGWLDLDSPTLIYPLAYKVWYQQADAAVILYAGASPHVVTTLPMGDAANGYALTLYASVTDSDGAETRTSIDVVVMAPPVSFNLTTEAIGQAVSESQTSADAQAFLGSVASLLGDSRSKRSADELRLLGDALVAQAIGTGQRQDLTPGGLSRTTSLYSLLTQLNLSEEASLQALNATQEMTRRTQELGASDEDLMASVVGVLSNLLVKAESLRRDNNSTLPVNYGLVAPEVLGPAATVELSKAVCGQDLDPYSASSMSLSLFTGCCERSVLAGAVEADGARAVFKVPSSLNAQAGLCADFFMTAYARSPFPRADVPTALNEKKKQLGSQVYGLVALNANGTAVPVANLSQEIVISLPVLDTAQYSGDSSDYEYACAFLDTEVEGAEWSGRGCRFLDADTTDATGRIVVRCACNHLTDFGLLMRAKPGSSDDVALPVAVAVSVAVAVCVVLVVAVIVVVLAVRRRRRMNRELSSLASAVNVDGYDLYDSDPDERL